MVCRHMARLQAMPVGDHQKDLLLVYSRIQIVPTVWVDVNDSPYTTYRRKLQRHIVACVHGDWLGQRAISYRVVSTNNAVPHYLCTRNGFLGKKPCRAGLRLKGTARLA